MADDLATRLAHNVKELRQGWGFQPARGDRIHLDFELVEWRRSSDCVALGSRPRDDEVRGIGHLPSILVLIKGPRFRVIASSLRARKGEE
ncbi:MAG: hypothetical protein IPI67_17180 [Myxococcales bacterium]|nr:hypothetical protein [Myxococcales bacterium]